MTTCRKSIKGILTKGKQYRVSIILNGQAFVKTDRNTFGWFPAACFEQQA